MVVVEGLAPNFCAVYGDTPYSGAVEAREAREARNIETPNRQNAIPVSCFGPVLFVFTRALCGRCCCPPSAASCMAVPQWALSDGPAYHSASTRPTSDNV